QSLTYFFVIQPEMFAAEFQIYCYCCISFVQGLRCRGVDLKPHHVEMHLWCLDIMKFCLQPYCWGAETAAQVQGNFGCLESRRRGQPGKSAAAVDRQVEAGFHSFTISFKRAIALQLSRRKRQAKIIQASGAVFLLCDVGIEPQTVA